MTMVDLSTEGPLTLESLLLSRQLAGSPPNLEVLLTHEQMRDVYSELQEQVRFVSTDAASAGTWSGMTFTTVEAA